MNKDIIGLDGKQLKKEEKVLKDYSSIKISDIYQPRAFDVIVQEPFNFKQLLEKAQLMQEKEPTRNLDQVFEVQAVGTLVSNCKIGDKVYLKGGQMQPINLVAETQYQIHEDQIAGVVTNLEYEQIRRFFAKKREDANIAKGLSFRPMGMGYDRKTEVPGHFNPQKDLPN